MSDARIYDRGYRRFEGQRLGASAAVSTLIVHSVQRVLGLKRPVRSKIMPAITILFAYVPAIVFVGMAAFLPEQLIEEDILPSYGDYYGFITFAVLLFVAFVAPEVLCTDRRTRMLGIYLASPLTRDTYLLAKVGSVMLVLLTVTLGPPLLLLIAYTFEGAGPDSVVEFVELFAKIVVVGGLMAAFYTAISLAIAAMSDRRAIASTSIALTILVSGGVVNGLIDASDGNDSLVAFDLLNLPFEMAQKVHGETPFDFDRLDVSGGFTIFATVAWILVAGLFLRQRYQMLTVGK